MSFLSISFLSFRSADVPSNESQFSSSNTTEVGFDTQGAHALQSQFTQAPNPADLYDSYNLGMAQQLFQLPSWAKDNEFALGPETVSPIQPGNYFTS